MRAISRLPLSRASTVRAMRQRETRLQPSWPTCSALPPLSAGSRRPPCAGRTFATHGRGPTSPRQTAAAPPPLFASGSAGGSSCSRPSPPPGTRWIAASTRRMCGSAARASPPSATTTPRGTPSRSCGAPSRFDWSRQRRLRHISGSVAGHYFCLSIQRLLLTAAGTLSQVHSFLHPRFRRTQARPQAAAPFTLTAELREGDVLLLPPFFLHDVTALSDASISYIVWALLLRTSAGWLLTAGTFLKVQRVGPRRADSSRAAPHR